MIQQMKEPIQGESAEQDAFIKRVEFYCEFDEEQRDQLIRIVLTRDLDSLRNAFANAGRRCVNHNALTRIVLEELQAVAITREVKELPPEPPKPIVVEVPELPPEPKPEVKEQPPTPKAVAAPVQKIEKSKPKKRRLPSFRLLTGNGNANKLTLRERLVYSGIHYGLVIRKIADSSGCRMNTVTAVIKRLEAAGHVKKVGRRWQVIDSAIWKKDRRGALCSFKVVSGIGLAGRAVYSFLASMAAKKHGAIRRHKGTYFSQCLGVSRQTASKVINNFLETEILTVTEDKKKWLFVPYFNRQDAERKEIDEFLQFMRERMKPGEIDFNIISNAVYKLGYEESRRLYNQAIREANNPVAYYKASLAERCRK